MLELEDENCPKEFIKKNNEEKTKIFQKLDCITNDISSLLDLNENIYSNKSNLVLSSHSKNEKILKASLLYKDFLLKKGNEEIDSINDKIIKEYNRITGISILRTEDSHLRIDFNFLGNKNEYFIILSFHNSFMNVVDINPKTINYQKYVDEYNQTNDISLFLCELINYEFIPYKENKIQ